MNTKMTVTLLKKKKNDREKITSLALYDYACAQIADELGIDLILVGDSLANTFFGYDSTLKIGMAEMEHHVRAVKNGVQRALLIADMPFLSYGQDLKTGVENAGKFLQLGAEGVKIEGEHLELVKTLTKIGVPVLGHLGILPQSLNTTGGYKIQGKTEQDATRLLQSALNLQEAGIFALILEGVATKTAAQITTKLSIPVIGIGAGVHCDGQIIVANDIMGLTSQLPKHARIFKDVKKSITECFQAFRETVATENFPAKEESFS